MAFDCRAIRQFITDTTDSENVINIVGDGTDGQECLVVEFQNVKHGSYIVSALIVNFNCQIEFKGDKVFLREAKDTGESKAESRPTNSIMSDTDDDDDSGDDDSLPRVTRKVKSRTKIPNGHEYTSVAQPVTSQKDSSTSMYLFLLCFICLLILVCGLALELWKAKHTPITAP